MTQTGSIQRRLLVGTAMVVSSFVAYGRRAYANCVVTTGSTYLCSNASGAQTINMDGADVVTESGFSVDATGTDAITITGDEPLSFTDKYGSSIVSDDENGLYVHAEAGDPSTATSIDIYSNGSIEGGERGILTQNDGHGATNIEIAGEVRAGSLNGIRAHSGIDSGAVTITTDAGSSVRGGYYGIKASSDGSGPLTITTHGDVSGGDSGIGAFNDFSDLNVTVDGEVEGGIVYGIYARNRGSNLTIDTEAGSSVTGGRYGIRTVNYGDGAVTITADGDVTGESDNGIRAYNSADGSDLTITTGPDSTVKGGNFGIYADQAGDGSLDITINGGVSGGSEGIYARNRYEGSTSITVNGNVSGSIDGIEAKNLQNSNTTDLTITVAADASVSSDDNGIYALNGGTGELHITVDGYVSGGTGGGIHAQNEGTDLTIDLGADSTVTAGTAWGVYGRNLGSGNLVINANGDVSANPNPSNGIDSGTGIRAQNSSNGKALTITTAAGHSVSGGFYGISAENNGSGPLTITTNGDVTGRAMDGIYARSGGAGAIVVNANDDVSGGRRGIFVRNLGTGDAEINTLGDVTGSSEDGIHAYNSAAGGKLTVTTGANHSVTGGDDGIQADNYGHGSLTIVANGDVEGQSDDGIDTYNAGEGALILTANGNVSGVDNGIVAEDHGTGLTIETGANSSVTGGYIGIFARNRGAGDAELRVLGDVTAESDDGIYAYNSADSGELKITTGAGHGVTGADDGIQADNYGRGDLTIAADGDIFGQSDDGIDAYNAGEGGLIITTNGDVSGVDAGIDAENQAESSISITANGKVTGGTGPGISAYNSASSEDLTITTGAGSSISSDELGIGAVNYGSGTLQISVDGDVSGAAQGGIFAENYGNGLKITTGADGTVTGDTYGIYAVSYGDGTLGVTADGKVTGQTGAGIHTFNNGSGTAATAIAVGATGEVEGASSAIRAQSSGQSVEITNSGFVHNVSGLASDLAIEATGGTASLTNSGHIVGRVALGASADIFSNSGVWSTSGDNDFGGGADLLGNLATGTLFTASDPNAAETTSFSGLETFINSGALSMQDGGAGDTTIFSGDFVSSGTVVIDTELGGDGSPTDLLVIEGESAGTSTLVVDNAGGSGAQTTGDGIRVVEVDGSSPNDAFTLGQPVTAGIYRYDLYYGGIADPADGDWYLRSTLAPSANTYLALPQILLGFNRMPTLAARLGGRAWSGPEGQGLWMRMDGGQGTFRSNGALSGAFDSNWREMEAGADFDLADTFAGGRLVGGITAHADWINADLSPSGVDSSLDGTGYGIGATLTWYGPSGFYVDSQARATWFNADIGGADTSAKDIDGLGYALGIEAGRHIRLGGGWSLTPQAQLVYSHVDFDRFTDSSGVDVSLRRGESLRARAGLAVGRDFAFSRSGWQAGLYGLANVGYEALGDTSVDAGGAALDWGPQRLWGDVGLGASIKAGDGVSFFGEATYAASLQDFSSSHTLTGRVGIRMQW